MSKNDEKSTMTKENKLTLISLTLARFATITPTLIVGLILVDIATTFQCPIGLAGQLQTAASLAGLIGALLLTAISVRYKSSTLLLVGLILITFSAVGSYLAPTFTIMLIVFTLAGLGNAVISPMAMALVGERFQPQHRSHAMSWLTAGVSLANVIGAPIIGLISSNQGWRNVYLLYGVPLFSAVLLISYLTISREEKPKQVTSVNILDGFKGVFSNISAIGCLLGNTLTNAAYQAILLYGASFFRQRFLMSMTFVSIITLVGALLFTIGGLVSGPLVNKFDRKTITVFSSLATGLPIILFTNLSNVWVSIGLMFIGRFFYGVLVTSSNLLFLEQVPSFRGSMMSLAQAAAMLGQAVGATIGGWALLVSGYDLIGGTLGIIMIVAAILFQILSKDPLTSL